MSTNTGLTRHRDALLKLQEAVRVLEDVKLQNISLEGLCERIQEVVNTHCSDYPDHQNLDAWEGLYAISSSLEGIKKANDDWSAFLTWVCERHKFDKAQLLKDWYDKNKESTNVG